MKITHTLGHRSNWNIDIFTQQGVGDYFLITAYSNGTSFQTKKNFQNIHDVSMIDLQFYSKEHKRGKLSEFDFHPANIDLTNATNVYLENCVIQAINYQKELGFQNIIIPLFYENDDVADIIKTIKSINRYIKTIEKGDEKYFMTLPFANHVIIDKDKVEEILFECTDMGIAFDGYFVASENKPEFRRKVTTEIKVIKNLSKVLKTLKAQGFQTIYAYANWDAILYLAQTDIDYITIGSFENLRNFDIKRFTEKESGGPSKGYYFSEKLLNMIKADSLTLIKDRNSLEMIRNEKNIFSDIILVDNYEWSIQKPDVHKNYLLSITKMLNQIASIPNVDSRKKTVLYMIDNAIYNYNLLEDNRVYLDKESSNYHLNTWKTYLANS